MGLTVGSRWNGFLGHMFDLLGGFGAFCKGGVGVWRLRDHRRKRIIIAGLLVLDDLSWSEVAMREQESHRHARWGRSRMRHMD